MSKEKALKSARRWREDADIIEDVYKVGRALDNMSSYLLSSDFEELVKAKAALDILKANGTDPESLKKPEGIGDKCDQCGADVMAENKYYTGSTFGPRTLCTKCWEAPQPQVTYDHE